MLQSKLYLVIAKNIVSISSENKVVGSMFWVLFVRKYSKLTKLIQKIDPNSRMPRISMNSVDKSTKLNKKIDPNSRLPIISMNSVDKSAFYRV